MSSPPLRRAIALSGGPDSLYAACRMPAGLALIVDHGLRAGSRQEAETAAALAQEMGHEPHILTWQPAAAPRTQAAYRAARYALLARACARHGIAELWTGHQREDQGETVLLRLANASGLMGLSGMATRTWLGNARLYRPLLNTPKVEIEGALAARGLRPVRDPSNEDLTYPRVQMRRLLAKNPRVLHQVTDLAMRVGTLRNQALRSLAGLAVTCAQPGELRISGALKGLDDAALGELFTACARWVSGQTYPNIRPMVAAVCGGLRKGQQVSAGRCLMFLSRDEASLTLLPENRRSDAASPYDRAAPLLTARAQALRDGLFISERSGDGGLILGSRPRFDHEFATK